MVKLFKTQTSIGKGENARFKNPSKIYINNKEKFLLVTNRKIDYLKKILFDGSVITINNQPKLHTFINTFNLNKTIYSWDYDYEKIYIKKHKDEESTIIASFSFCSGLSCSDNDLYIYGDFKFFKGEDLIHIAGTGKIGYKDGFIFDAQFSSIVNEIIATEKYIYILENNSCIRRIELYVDWNRENHWRTKKITRDAIKTIFILQRKRNNIGSRSLFCFIPKDVLFVIYAFINKLNL